MNIAGKWEDYEILDAKDGEKLERWGKYILIRPDPQIIWNKVDKNDIWEHFDGRYNRSQSGGGQWEFKNVLPKSWQIKYKELIFNIKPMGFKHTGIFPEQAVNWDWMTEKIKKEKEKDSKKEINVLNLFAYTGGASVACLSAGASVCHVDSSKGMVEWAKENVKSSKLEKKPIRYIVDDVMKFVKREIRRENKYDAIIMDPPSYGRGASGEVWNFEKDISNLVSLCSQLLTKEPLFFIVNSYTTGISSETISNILKLNLKLDNISDNIYSGELGLPIKDSKIILPCGIFSRWEK